MAVYFASKAYLVSLSQALMREFRGTGVTVTCLCPGPLRTPFLARAGAQQVRSFKVLRKLPVDEVARAGWEAMKAGRSALRSRYRHQGGDRRDPVCSARTGASP